MASKAVISSFLISMVVMQQIFFASACYPECGPKPVPKPNPIPTPHYPAYPHCPIDALKLGVCVDLLHGLLNLVIGHPPSGSACCPLIEGLVDLEAAACLCTIVKADVLGIHLNLDVKLSLLANTCGCKIPAGYVCA